MTIDAQPTVLSNSPVTVVDDYGCDIDTESGQCLYCTGPETD